jgi:hypothetical protein
MLDTFTGAVTAMAPTLSILVSSVGSQIPFQFGTSYLDLITKPIPRPLFPNKGLPFDTQMKNAIFPSTASQGMRFSFSATSEPHVNFEVMGVVVLFFLHIYQLHNKIVVTSSAWDANRI